ncbi:SFT2-domain-containing protein [Neoconidiobolus thromboides FSU 785]|nr:SFT2-domain-containing protein [Neoconidiobolus thromboides FSU 785]
MSNYSNQFASSTSSFFSSISNSASQYLPANTSPYAANSYEPEPEWFELTLFQRWAGFGICALAGFILFALVIAPFQIFSPSKFALSFTFGSLLLFTSFGLLKGPRSHFKHVFSKERLPFTACYFGSMGLTLISALIIGSKILTLLSFIIQLVALVWYFASYLPGGSAAMARSAASLLPY